jgi:hypothetical protein
MRLDCRVALLLAMTECVPRHCEERSVRLTLVIARNEAIQKPTQPLPPPKVVNRKSKI